MRRPTILCALALAGTFLAVAVAPSPGAHAPYSSWGSRGSGDGQFDQPMSVAVDAAGSVYVADSLNDRIQKFSPEGALLAKWGSTGSAGGQFQSAFGLAVGPQGHIYVADRNNNRIQRFTPDGAFVLAWGSAGTGDGQFRHPNDVTVDSQGNVYVADYDNRRVQKFTAEGAFLTKWGSAGSGDGQFDYVYAVAADPAGNVYVADVSSRVQKFDSNGGFIAQVGGGRGFGPGQFNFGAAYTGLGTDGDGNLYVADAGNSRIQKFAPDGQLLDIFGNRQELNRPADVAIAPSGDAIVADRFNYRIVAFREAAAAPLPPPEVGRTVNVEVVTGEVRVKPPGQAGGFVPLTESAQIAVGSLVDVSKGTVRMTSAADTQGATQSGDFSRGRFKVTQRRARKPVTTLKLKGGSFRACRRNASKRSTTARRRRIRRLSGNARGRFRTRGRHGAATVRGTRWVMEDRCDGTLVRVQEGVVAMRDFARRRTVRVRARGRYLARPRSSRR